MNQREVGPHTDSFASALRAALTLTDVLIVPLAPRSFDVWALSDIHELILEALSVRDGLRAFAVLNKADPRGSDNAEAAAAVAEFRHIEYLNTPIGNRKSVASAAGKGLAVAELRPADPKATAELQTLAGIFAGYPANIPALSRRA